MNLILHISLCGFLILCTVGVAIYRHWLENHCDHYIHLHNDSHDLTVVDAQSAMCRRFAMVDRLRTGMISAVVVYAAAIIGIAIYQGWNSAGM
jgi:hypothetical protein